MKSSNQKLFNIKAQKRKRQSLRNNATPAEKKLWAHLRGSQLLNHKFRRQHGIGPYIADFYCPEAKLVIELDGGVHFTKEARKYDRERDRFLSDHGIHTIRFRNEEVFCDVNSLLQTIAKYVQSTADDE